MFEFIASIFSYLYMVFNFVLFIGYTFILNYVYKLNKNNMLMLGLYTFIMLLIHFCLNVKTIMALLSIVAFGVFYMEQKCEFYYFVELLNKFCKNIKDHFYSNKKLEKYRYVVEFDNKNIVYYVDKFFTTLKPVHDYMEKNIVNAFFSEYITSATENSFSKLIGKSSISNENNDKMIFKKDEMDDLMQSLSKTINHLQTSVKNESFNDFLVTNSESESESESGSELGSEPQQELNSDSK